MEYRFFIISLSLAFWESETSSCKHHVNQDFAFEVETVLLTDKNSTCKRNYFIFDNMLAEKLDEVEIHYHCTPQARWLSGRRVFLNLPQGKQVCTDRWNKTENSNCILYTRRSSTGGCSGTHPSKCLPVVLKGDESVRIFTWRTDLLKFNISYKLTKCKNHEDKRRIAPESALLASREVNPATRRTPTKDSDSSSAKWCVGDDGNRIPHTQWELDGFPYNCVKTRGCPLGLVQETTGRCEKTCIQALTRLGGRFSCNNKCICPRGRYRNPKGKCVAVQNCQNLSDEVETTTTSSEGKTPSEQDRNGLSTEITLVIAAIIFLMATLLGIGFACWRKKHNTRHRSVTQSAITDATITPYAETTAAAAAAGYTNSHGINDIGRDERAPSSECSYIEPETLPSKRLTDAKSDYANQEGGPSTPFHQYEQIQPIQSAVDGYLRPVTRSSVEEASGYQSTSQGYINDSGYLEIDFESKRNNIA